jgi:TRAP-type C4-dicarboxylate transport system permease small subunit
MKQQYVRAMDAVHNACLFVAGSCLVIITLIVPYGVFTRYVLNSAASWPEPLAVLLMIVLSFLSAVVCYREHLHIGVGVLPGLLAQPWKSLLGWLLEICMLATNLFMVVWGIKLVEATWYQSIAEFPIVTAGMTYLPIPIGGALTVLFVIERLVTQDFFRQPEPETVSQISTE